MPSHVSASKYHPYAKVPNKCLTNSDDIKNRAKQLNVIDMSCSPSQSDASCMSMASSTGASYLSLDFSKQNFSNCTQPQIIMLVAPETHFRYRYDTEMSGAHGSLQANRAGREKQIPTVQLINYSGPAVVRVSLATCNEGIRYPHPHHLFVREKLYQRRYKNLEAKQLYKTGHYMDPHYIVVSDTDFIGKFEGMCIISSKKELFSRVVADKLQHRGHGNDGNLDEKVQEALRNVDIAFVSLCFEAFEFHNGIIGAPICPPLYSDPIANAKNASCGKLKITKINKCSGSCQGGDSIWLLVEKINKKGLIVRFFEHAMDGTLLWESVINGDKLELHYQYAVIFNTPPFRDQDLTREVTVSMRLERQVVPFDYSDPETFVYEPCKQRFPRNDNIYRKENVFTTGIPNKRPMADLIPNYMVPSKRRNEDYLSSDAYDSIPYEEHSDKEFQAILRELLQIDNGFAYGSVVQIDGADDRQRILLKVLQALVARAKLRDGDVKAVTEKIGRLFLRPDDLRLQDAASTLLSLRSANLSKKVVQEAIVAKDMKMLVAALKSGVSLSEVDEDCRTGLHLAVLKQNKDALKLLLEQKTISQCIDSKDKDGLSALHMAINENDVEAVKSIIDAGADVTVGLDNGKTTLETAVSVGNPDIIKIIKSQFDNQHSKTMKTESVSVITLNSKPKGTKEKIAEVLNISGKWKNLASLWDIPQIIFEANNSSNPAMFVIEEYEKKEKFDLEVIRNLLDALDEKEAVAIVDEALAKLFM